MVWRRYLFDALFRIGRPVWDTPTPREVCAVIEGDGALPPGRALDLGCGTSPNVIYLAQHGWDALGVDFSAEAIRRSTTRALGVPGARFVEADVTKLRESGITGPFDLVIDNGCYHALSAADKLAYVREVAAVMPSGAPLLMWEGIRIGANEIPERFGTDFVVERVEAKPFVIERKYFTRPVAKNAHWYWLRRR